MSSWMINGVSFFGGATANVLIDGSDAYFKPYSSVKDVALRTMSVVTAPVAIAAVTLSNTLITCGYLFKAIGDTLSGEFSHAYDDVKEAGSNCLVVGVLLIAALLSPLANLIDLIGSVFVKEPTNQVSNVFVYN